MKLITILLLLTTTFSIYASNWMKVSDIQSSGISGHSLKSECEKSGEQCLDVGEEPEVVKNGFTSLSDVLGDDGSRPIYSAEADVEVCSDEEQCYSIRSSKVCADIDSSAYVDELYSKVYCTKITGYQQKVVGKSLVKNESGWSAFKAQKAAAAALDAAKAQARKMRDCLSGVIDLMLVLNSQKSLTKGQVKQMVQTYAPILNLIYSGSPASTRDEISAVAVDGVMVTNADKTALIAEVDKCIGN